MQTRIAGHLPALSLLAASEPTTQTTTMSDPVGNAFTVKVPVGWASTPEYAARVQANHEQSMAQIQAFGDAQLRQLGLNPSDYEQ